MVSILGRLSRIINRYTGGAPGQTLCARIAAEFGSNCIFCRVVDRFTERDHCARELELDSRRLHRKD